MVNKLLIFPCAIMWHYRRPKLRKQARVGGLVGYVLISGIKKPVINAGKRYRPNRRDVPAFKQQERQLRSVLGRRLREVLGDDPSTAKHLGQRSDLVHAVNLVQFKQRDAVAVVDESALGADRLTAAFLVIELGQLNVSVRDVTHDVDLTADLSSWKQLIQNADITAAAESKKEVTSFKRQLTHFKKRTHPGRKDFGTKPGEKETLALILKLRRKPRKGQCMSYRKIAAELNRLQRPTRRGGRWTPRTVQGIDRRVRLILNSP